MGDYVMENNLAILKVGRVHSRQPFAAFRRFDRLK